jgi:uncharacterized membrane protein YebE (DUF533 family)
MKKIFIILIFTVFSSAYADGHITKKQKQEIEELSRTIYGG